MRKDKVLLAVIGCMIFAPWGALALPEADGFTPNQEAPGQPVTYSVESNEDYAKKIEKRLDDLYREYQQFEFKTNSLKDDAAATVKETMRAWEAKRQEVLVMLDKLRFTTANAWETDKMKMNSAVEDLEKSFAEMRSKTFSSL